MPTITYDTAEASSCIAEINLMPLQRWVTIVWKTGHISAHEVRRRDMLRLMLDRRLSFGQWANRFAIDR